MDLQIKLKNREKVFGTTVGSVRWSGLLQMMKNDILDFIVFDFEHGCLTVESAEELLRMCNVLEIPAIARVQEISYAYMSKIFDMGADGILVPRVETVEQVEMVVSSVRFPPKGKKGCGGFSLLHGGLKSTEEFNARKIIILQIESPLGISNLESMLDIDEADGVIIGPNDMSIAMGIPWQFNHPMLLEGIDTVLRICQKHDVSCGIYCDNQEEARNWRGKGMNILWTSSELGFFKKAYDEMCTFMKNLG
ncbi:MAG: aldolase/citrate lyase family protein [Sphaerochaetaceae bacterium]|jgi:2-keto-3-deoxy-L-rhamnonate aldolase RhmA|nr:aldolase/citrate lyase family protein [Sphaerochaetaceae bacterium]